MIVSASRRTDLPAFYSGWLLNRLHEGYALARNPLNAKQIRRVDLSPDAVDGLVLWSKNPAPLLPHLNALKPFAFYFQFTLNPYDRDIEPRVPPLNERVDTLLRLSDMVSPYRVVWRYDPVLLSPNHSMGYHVDRFGELAQRLSGHVAQVMFSFLDIYKKIEKQLAFQRIEPPNDDLKRVIAAEFAAIAKQHHLPIAGCCEPAIAAVPGIEPGRCIDAERLSGIAGRSIQAKRDPSQRPGCACAQAVDIGAYDCCVHGCVYCYANRSAAYVQLRAATHNQTSAILIGGT